MSRPIKLVVVLRHEVWEVHRQPLTAWRPLTEGATCEDAVRRAFVLLEVPEQPQEFFDRLFGEIVRLPVIALFGGQIVEIRLVRW